MATVQANPTVLFAESQRFTQPWLWALVLIPAGIVPLIIVFMPHPKQLPAGPLAAVMAMMVLCVGIFFAATLTVSITPAEVHVRYVPFFVNKRIATAEIASFVPQSYTVWQAGYGIHYSKYGWVYNTSGNEGIQLFLRNGKKMLIGTQRPRDFASALAQAGVKQQ